MDPKTVAKLIGVMVLLSIAAASTIRYFRNRGGDADGMVYFYDLTEQKLFPAPRPSVPPIRGINNAEQDGVRAIVISDSGNPKDKKHQHIAYLEKYTAEIKAQFEAVRQGGAGGQVAVRRDAVPANTLVRRLNEPEWHPMNSPEGEKIVSEWNVPGPDGSYPTVCVP